MITSDVVLVDIPEIRTLLVDASVLGAKARTARDVLDRMSPEKLAQIRRRNMEAHHDAA